MLMVDGPREQGMRRQMIERLQADGIANAAVLCAMSKVPRHFFIDSALINFAYKSTPFPIGSSQTISNPYTVAFQSHLIDIKPGMKVLEIGTGSGYQTAVLLELGATVFTIERQHELYEKVCQLLPQMGYNPHFVFGDGYEGVPTEAPFDRILVTAGATQIPQQLLLQLAIGGIMVIPVGNTIEQRMIRIVRKSASEFSREDFGKCAFVPFLKGTVND